jgi:tryptophanyl-tRNA synthetase
MSKSHTDPRSRILITDSPGEIEKKIRSALTDSQNSISYDPQTRPGVSNLLDIMSALDPRQRSPGELALALADASIKELKTQVTECIINHFGGIRQRYHELLSADEGRYLDSVAAEGARMARVNAEETMHIVREALGL